MRILGSFLALHLAALAQIPVAPTPEIAGPAEGSNIGNYNVINSAELGYRFASIGGNPLQYRSAVNYGNGMRLLGSSLSVTSRDGKGRLLDQLSLTSRGLGNDPYEAANLRAEKYNLYRYDLLWRQNNYFNPGLVTAGGSGNHLLDTRYRMQDHNLTLFPQSNWKFFLGSTLNSRAGLGYSSIQPTPSADVIPLTSNIYRAWREYRLGSEFRLLGMRVNWMRGWQDFKDDTSQVLAVNGIPGLPVNGSPPSLTGFAGASPYHGTANYWRANLSAQTNAVSLNGQFSYTAGQRAFVVDESLTGAAPGGPIQNVITRGAGQRPVATGNFNLNITPNRRLTISNSSALYNVRTLGSSVFSQLDQPSQLVTLLFYNYLGIRTVANDTTVNYQLGPSVTLMGAYHYSNRKIRSIEQFSFQGSTNTTPSAQTNEMKAGDAGIRFSLWKGLAVVLSAELGRNSRPFTPRGSRNYHSFNGRAQYRARTVQVSAAVETRYNTNSVSLTSYGSQSRNYSINGAWTLSSSFAVDIGFTRNHTYTIGGIAYFSGGHFATGQTSLYLSNLNSLYASVRRNFGDRVDLYVGYNRVQDTGDGRQTPTGDGIGSPNPVLQAVQTFPLTYQSPSARVSLRVHANLRWNAGYQYYNYTQKFTPGSDFRAHTGYLSLSVSF